MDFSGCPDDASFGPAVRGCRGDFDFTIKFEKIFFSTIPPPVFVAFSLARIVYLARKPATVGGALLRTAKLAAICVFGVLQLALLVLSSTQSGRFGAFFIPADVLTLLSVVCTLPLSYLEHSRSPRPSILLSAYLFVTILLDIAQARTLWLASTNSDEFAYSRVFTSCVAFKALIIILESHSKSRWIRWDVKEHSPEETTGLYGLGAYVWLNKLFLAGYRKILRIDDLFPLDKAMTSETLHTKLSHHIDISRFRGKRHGLAQATARALAVPLLLPVGPRIALGAFQFCQPFLINTLLEYLKQPAGQSPTNIGYGLIGATAIIYVGIAASNALYWYFQGRAMYMARGLLATAIYRKTTESRSTDSDDSAALTLMSADIERIIIGCLNLHEFWANTIEVALACWLLSRQIGPASVAPLIVVSGCVVCSAILARFTGARQKRWMEKIQKRVGLTSTVIGQMKHLKISGLAETVQDAIQSMRIDELEAGSSFRRVIVFAATVGYTPLFLSPVIAFAFASRTLEVTTIFTSMSFIMLLAAPLGVLFQMIPNLLAAFACLNRIQTFLEQEPRFDFRSFSGVAEEKPLAEEKSCQTVPEQPTAKVSITDGSFGWEVGKKGLRNINLEVPASRLTIVVGPVASGKSTLCKTLLGEVPVFQGRVVTTASSYRKIGYCDQNPYLFNATIRENILGFSPFNQERYDEVIEATMLRPDLDLLPEGDNTNIGSNGITLSGGQKQRVSMARALYLDTDFCIFDDILSGLDADTEEEVFLRVFSPAGLLRRRGATALLCTHSVRHLPLADHIVALGADGTIVEQGSFNELMANERYVTALGVEHIDRSRLLGRSSLVERASPKQDPPKPISAKLPAVSEEAEGARMTGDWAVYRHYYARINVLHRIGLLIFSIGWGSLQNAGTVWLTFWSEGVSAANPPHSNSFYNGIYAVFQVGTLASLFAIAYLCFTSMITVSGAKMHKEALKTVISAPLRFFATTDAGVIVNLFSQDMTLVDGQLPQALLNLLLGIFETLGLAAVIATSSPYVAITYPFLAMILYVLQKFYLRTSRQIRLLDLEAKSPLYSHFIDTIKGIATFRAFGWVQDGISQTSRLLDTSQRPAYLLAMIQRWLALVLQLVVAVLALCVVTLATQLRSNTALTGASLVALMSFGEQLALIIRFYTDLETSIGAVSRLKAFSENVKPESREGETLVPPAEWPLHGAIEINAVSAAYGDSGDEDTAKDLALDNLNLTIAPGEKVAICGRSGSGKSSLLLLLLRLLDPLASTTTVPTPDEEEGKTIQPKLAPLTIDGLPLHAVSRPHLRRRVIALPQEPVFLPSGTPVQTNLDPDHSATAADCRAALEAVSLWPFIASRGGLDAPLAPDTLSQGQKQLFSLARAIVRRRVRARERAAEFGSDYCGDLRDGGVLLLDEVSSSVDQETDEEMQRVIRAEFAAYTIVMVSHRLGMVMGFDRVVVMDAGRIVESGRPGELVEREGSRFRELWMVGNGGKG